MMSHTCFTSVSHRFGAVLQENTVLSNWMAQGFRAIAERPAAVAANLNLPDETIKKLLVRSQVTSFLSTSNSWVCSCSVNGMCHWQVNHMKGNRFDHWETACNWLSDSANLEMWQDWSLCQRFVANCLLQ